MTLPYARLRAGIDPNRSLWVHNPRPARYLEQNLTPALVAPPSSTFTRHSQLVIEWQEALVAHVHSPS